MANDQNLTPFLPGQSGNPTGRPKGPITQFLREFGSATQIRFTIEIDKVDRTGKPEKSVSTATISTGEQTINQAIAARLLQMAMNGDIKAIREVLNRTEGRVPHPIAVSRSVDQGAELKAWSAEEVDRYEAWLQQQGIAETVNYEEVNESEDETDDEDEN